MTLTADVIADDGALRALVTPWRDLWRRAGKPPFQSVEWLLPWWGAFGNGAPRVAALRNGDALVGLLPLYRLSDQHGTRLLPLGAGITDYQDALLAPEAPPDAAARLLGAALAGETACDLIDVPAAAALRDLSPPGWETAWRDADPCPVMRLGASLRESMPTNAHRKLRMNRNRAERAGCRVARAGAEALSELVALHESRWRGGVLGDPAVIAFHRAALPGLLAAGIARLWLLTADGRPVAALLALLSPDSILLYLSGYDTSRADISPGSVLLGAVLEEAIAEGRTEAHFLRGDEPYKAAWGAVPRMNATGRLRRA